MHLKFPIDTTQLTFIVADAPQQARDFNTKEPKTTPDGLPVFVVSLLAMDGKDSAPLRIRVDGDPGVQQGQTVHLIGLVFNKSSGTSDMTWWTAETVRPVTAPHGEPRNAPGGKASA